MTDDLEVMYTDNQNNKTEGSNSTERNKNKNHNKSDTNEKNKNKTDKSDSMEKKKNKSDKNDSSESNKNKKDKNQKDKKEVDKNETPDIVTSDYSDDNIIDISKQEVPPEVFTGGNIFMHIDPTVKKKNGTKIEKKPATPPTTRIRSSQLSKFVNIRQYTIKINIILFSLNMLYLHICNQHQQKWLYLLEKKHNICKSLLGKKQNICKRAPYHSLTACTVKI